MMSLALLQNASTALETAAESLRCANGTADPVVGLLTLALIERAVLLERDVLALKLAIAAREDA